MRLLLSTGLLLALALGCAGSADPPAPAAAPVVPVPVPVPVPVAAPQTSARPLYYDRAITPADLEGRTLRELSLMRNTIFARAGNPFVKPWLNEYFRAQPWYAPKDKVDLAKLTDYDRANVKIITDAEQSVDRATLVARRDRIRAGVPSAEDRIELALIGAALGEYSGDASVPVAQRNPLEDPTVLDGQLTVAQIEGMSRRDLRLLRNTVYARRGRPFQSPVLQMYFYNKDWYTANDAFKESMLSELDKRNIQLVQSMEDRLGGPMREWEHQREEGWFEGA